MLGAPTTPRLLLDTRPLWRVMLSRTRHWIIMGFVLAVFLALFFRTPFEGLTVHGQRTLAVFAVCLILWVTQALPLSVTGLLALLLLPFCTVGLPEPHVTKMIEDRLWATGSFALFGSEAVSVAGDATGCVGQSVSRHAGVGVSRCGIRSDLRE